MSLRLKAKDEKNGTHSGSSYPVGAGSQVGHNMVGNPRVED